MLTVLEFLFKKQFLCLLYLQSLQPGWITSRQIEASLSLVVLIKITIVFLIISIEFEKQ